MLPVVGSCGRRVLAAAAALNLLATVAAGVAASPAEADHGPEASFDAAREQYETGHYEVAFREFAALADRGHCEAARIAREMVRAGRALYPVAFAAAPERLERWRGLPGCGSGAPPLR